MKRKKRCHSPSHEPPMRGHPDLSVLVLKWYVAHRQAFLGAARGVCMGVLWLPMRNKDEWVTLWLVWELTLSEDVCDSWVCSYAFQSELWVGYSLSEPLGTLLFSYSITERASLTRDSRLFIYIISIGQMAGIQGVGYQSLCCAPSAQGPLICYRAWCPTLKRGIIKASVLQCLIGLQERIKGEEGMRKCHDPLVQIPPILNPRPEPLSKLVCPSMEAWVL